ncbi:fibronectin type III domain-containing protein [Chloroflexota bacterium]
MITIAGMPSGIEIIELNPAQRAIFDVAGNAALAATTTGSKTLNDQSAPEITSGALEFSDCVLTFNQGSGAATNVTIDSLKMTGGADLSGGESTIRAMLSVTGTPNGQETIEVKPANSAIFDAVGNDASNSTTSGGKTLNDQSVPEITDTTPPSVPTNLASGTVTASSIDLTWTASTDNVRVDGYRIYRDSVQTGTATSTFYSVTGLTSGNTYIYAVSAYDAVGNESDPSVSVSIQTQAQSSHSFDNPDPNWVFWDDFERNTMRDVATGYPWCYNVNANDAASPTDDIGLDYWPVYDPASAIDITDTEYFTGSKCARIRYMPNETGSSARAHLSFASTMPGELGLNQMEEIYVHYCRKFPSTWIWNSANLREMHQVLLNAGNFVVGSMNQQDLTIYQEHHVGPGVGEDEHYAEMTYVSDLQDDTEIMLPNPYNTYPQYRTFPNNIDISFIKGKWYEVEMYVKLNTFSGSSPVADGEIKLWIKDTETMADPVLAVDMNSLILRDSQHKNIAFHHLLIGPNLPPNGLPVAQENYIDSLVISTSRIANIIN